MSVPILSIVTLAFNQRPFLHRALASVPRDPRIEHIVVDPGSSDGTRNYLNERWKSSKKLVFESDSGPAEGLNNGFRTAQGEFGYFLNGDDFLLPDALNAFFKAKLVYPNHDIFLGGGYILDLIRQRAREVIMPPFGIRRYAAGAFPFFQQGFFFRMSEFRRVGGFNVNNRTCWDGELLVDMVLNGAKARHIRDAIGVFVLHESSITGSKRLQDLYKVDSERVLEKFRNLTGHRIWKALRRYSVFLVRFCSWGWALADLRDRLFPGYTYTKVRAVYNSLAEPKPQ